VLTPEQKNAVVKALHNNDAYLRAEVANEEEIIAGWDYTTTRVWLSENELDPGSYTVHLKYANKANSRGFLPSTGKTFTKPMWIVAAGIIALVLAAFGYIKMRNKHAEI
jgi:hypothetical protein